MGYAIWTDWDSSLARAQYISNQACTSHVERSAMWPLNHGSGSVAQCVDSKALIIDCLTHVKCAQEVDN